MTLAQQTAAALAMLPGYMVPCPEGSARLYTEWDWQRPRLFRGARSGALMFTKCRAACIWCSRFASEHRRSGGGIAFADEGSAAQAWNRAVLASGKEPFLSVIEEARMVPQP